MLSQMEPLMVLVFGDLVAVDIGVWWSQYFLILVPRDMAGWWVILAVGVWWDLVVGRCGCWWFWQLVILAIHNPSHLGKVAPGVLGDQMVPGAEHSHTSLLIYVGLNHSCSTIPNDGAKTTIFFSFLQKSKNFSCRYFLPHNLGNARSNQIYSIEFTGEFFCPRQHSSKS